MLLSIHDVPRYERHLLFCTRLRPRQARRRRHPRTLPAINRSLAIVGECVTAQDLVVPGELWRPTTGVA
jgi:hypothetical protein